MSAEKKKQELRTSILDQGEEVLGEPWWNGERIGEEGEEKRELVGRTEDDRQSNEREEAEEEMGEDELEGARMNDMRKEALSKIQEEKEVQRVMKQMLRSLSGMLKHEKVGESNKGRLEQKNLETVGKRSNPGWIPQPKDTPLWIPNSQKLTMTKRNTVPMIG